MSEPTPAPSMPDEETCRGLRAGLAASGYDEATVCGHLGCAAWTDILPGGRAVLQHRARTMPTGLRLLVELFTLGRDHSIDEIDAGLGPSFGRALERSGLLQREGSVARAAVSLIPMEGLLFASDRPERHAERAADFVLGPGGVTRLLADLTLRAPVEAALDLGCGAGVLGALCSAHARRVTATDVNPRAVAFSRFNAELNGLDRVECREGSLFEPVAGERFDLIVCNPPFVISPGETFLYRDGGTELCRTIVSEAPRHLSPTGVLQMMAEWPVVEGGDWKAEVGSWLEGVGCHAWVLQTYSQGADEYAARWLAQEFGRGDVPQPTFDHWVDHLSRLGIRSVGGGLIVLRGSGNETPRRLLREAPPIVPPTAASIGRWLGAQDFLAGLDDDARLLDVVLAPSPDAERIEKRRPTDDGWSAAASELRLRQGLAFGARVDPVAAELVGLLDGSRTPREGMALLAARHGVAVEPFLGTLPDALRRLVALGILLPVVSA
jgi:SAM-dependent methyltransferase